MRWVGDMCDEMCGEMRSEMCGEIVDFFYQFVCTVH